MSPAVSPDLVLLTWNLRRNFASANLALEFLSQEAAAGHPCIAAFQECPTDLVPKVKQSPELTIQPSSRKGNYAEWTNVVVTSSHVSVAPTGDKHLDNALLDSEGRCLGLTFESTRWSGLRFLAVHGWDRRSKSEGHQRSEWASIVRAILDGFWTKGPLIVAGDLNANPWDVEVTYRNGWFASRQATLRTRDKYKLANVGVYARPLVNLSWDIVSATNGTYHYFSDSDVEWHFLDQFLVSRDLASAKLSPSVLQRIGQTDLVDADGVPLRKRSKKGVKFEYSDHLPVELRIPSVNLEAVCPAPSVIEART